MSLHLEGVIREGVYTMVGGPAFLVYIFVGKERLLNVFKLSLNDTKDKLRSVAFIYRKDQISKMLLYGQTKCIIVALT